MDTKGCTLMKIKPLRISDHCLVRAWFKVGPTSKICWKNNKKLKIVPVIKKDEESLEQFRESFKNI